MSSRGFQDVFKTSWKTKNCYAEDVLKTSSRRLEDQQMFCGLLPFVNQVNPYLNSIDMCSTNEITKTVYIFKKNIKNYILYWKRCGYFLVFNKTIAFKHFLFINTTKLRFLLFFSDHQTLKSENWKSFKDFDVYLINVFRRVII